MSLLFCAILAVLIFGIFVDLWGCLSEYPPMEAWLEWYAPCEKPV
jgi:uncharacterized membrane protein YczE